MTPSLTVALFRLGRFVGSGKCEHADSIAHLLRTVEQLRSGTNTPIDVILSQWCFLTFTRGKTWVTIDEITEQMARAATSFQIDDNHREVILLVARALDLNPSEFAGNVSLAAVKLYVDHFHEGINVHRLGLNYGRAFGRTKEALLPGYAASELNQKWRHTEVDLRYHHISLWYKAFSAAFEDGWKSTLNVKPEELLPGAGCHAGKDGECNWRHCPQADPVRRQPHCPLDRSDDER